MDAMGRLAACAADAVGRNPKEGWQDALILACDDVEEVYDEMLAALKTAAVIVERLEGTDYLRDGEADEIRAAIAKAKEGE